MNTETNYMIETMTKIGSMMSGKQKKFWDWKINHAKPVKCVSVEEVLTPQEIERIKALKPMMKECFKNAASIVMFANIEGVAYVEGELGIGNAIGIEHAFNRRGDKYFDVTLELGAERDVTTEDYVSVLEVENRKDVSDVILECKMWTSLIPHFAMKELETDNKVSK